MSESTTSKPKAFEGWAVYTYTDLLCPDTVSNLQNHAWAKLEARTPEQIAAWQKHGFTCRRVRIEVVE